MEDNKKDDLNVEEIKLEISYDDEDGNNNVYACEKCPATFESKKKLNEHTKRIHHEKKIICPTCGFEVFDSNNHLILILSHQHLNFPIFSSIINQILCFKSEKILLF